MKIGAQLFTIRDFTQTTADFAASMKKIADIGYKCVQISGIGGDIAIKDVADICAANGLEIVVTHTNPIRVRDEIEAVIADHRTMGAKYVGIGAMPGEYERSEAGVRKFIADYTPASDALKKAGMMFMYHNHDFEWEKYSNKRMIEYLIDEFADLGFILDTYWVQAAGGDPAAWFNKLAGRIPVVHFKDMAWFKGSRRMAEVMEGNLNWPPIFEACRNGGVDYAMVEQDDCNGTCPFAALQTSYNNLKGVL